MNFDGRADYFASEIGEWDLDEHADHVSKLGAG
jgi:hypothetical protein